MATDYSREFDVYFFYDDETSGIIRKGKDKKQYPQKYDTGYIMTDKNLNIIEEGNIITKPRPDILPSPTAFAITRLDIEKLERMGIPEYESISKLQSLMLKNHRTCITGYNTIGFDDELTRHTLYRNLKNPYSHEWQNGNSRMDVYGLVQMAYAFCPEILEWPTNDEGKASLKLEHLAEANGIVHEQAHDALSDVKATIALAKLIKERNPSLWNYYQWLTDKENPRKVILNNDMIFQTATFFGKECRMTKPVKPIIVDRKVATAWHCIDLSASPESVRMLAQMTPDEIASYIFTKREDLPEGSPVIPLTKITTNKMPNIRKATAENIRTRSNDFRYNPDHVFENLAFINANPQLSRVIQEAMVSHFEKDEDPEFNIYSGFPSKRDSQTLDDLHSKDPSNPGKTKLTETPLSSWGVNLDDKDKLTLALRSKYGNYFQDLILRDKAPANELKSWFVDLENRIVKGNSGGYTFRDFEEELKQVRKEMPLDEEQIAVLDKLEKYVDQRKDQLREIKNDIRSIIREQAEAPNLG